jgi:hypothetical protein
VLDGSFESEISRLEDALALFRAKPLVPRTAGARPLEGVMKEALARAGEEAERSKPVEAEIERFFEPLCDAYAESTESARLRVRRALETKRSLLAWLCGYVSQGARELERTRDERILLRALAAASMDDGRLDRRDVILALDDLFLAAERAGIDPRPHFARMAEISSGEATAAGSTRDCLRRYADR